MASYIWVMSLSLLFQSSQSNNVQPKIPQLHGWLKAHLIVRLFKVYVFLSILGQQLIMTSI